MFIYLLLKTRNLHNQDYYPSLGNGGSKKPKVAEDVDLKCMQAFAEAKKIESLNIDKLKAFLKAVGVAVNSKMKKGDLVKEVYEYYDGMNAILND